MVEYEPALHNRQAVLTVAPSEAENVPAAQLVHCEEAVSPSEVDQVPGWHDVHMDADMPDHVPAGQLGHTMVVDVVGAAVWYVPAAHTGAVGEHEPSEMR